MTQNPSTISPISPILEINQKYIDVFLKTSKKKLENLNTTSAHLPLFIILGERGQLGFAFTQSLQALNLPYIGLSREDVDFSDFSALKILLNNIIKDVENNNFNNFNNDFSKFIIINACAYTAVDLAEQTLEQTKALKINHELPKMLADFCKTHNGLLLHYSTDYVFDGQLNELNPDLQNIKNIKNIELYTENHQTRPINFYGHSKYLGEQAILNSDCKALIFRTSWVFDDQHQNFFMTMLKLGRKKIQENLENLNGLNALENKGKPLTIIANQYGAPNFTYCIVDASLVAVFHILKNNINNLNNINNNIKNNNDLFGLYHLSQSGLVSWFEYAKTIFQTFEMAVDISPIPATAYPTPAARPMFSGLDTQKFTKNFNYSFSSWQEPFKYFTKNK